MGIFGRAPSGGGPPTSRRDRRQLGARARSKTGARRETERRAQVIVIVGFVVVAIAILGVAGFGYYQSTIRPKQQAVVKVGDRNFSMGYVEKRLRYEIRNATPGEPLLLNQDVAVVQTLNSIEAEELNRIGATQLDVSVGDGEIEAKIRLNLGLSDSADPATYADAYRTVVRDSGLSPNEYRELVGSQLLEDEIRKNLRSGIPASAEQIKLRDIRVVSQEDAQMVLDRLAAGEDFATIAAEVSYDTNTKNNGGEMGWMPRGALEPAVGDTVFALEVGQRTEPVWSSQTNTYYVYEVMEKSLSMEVTSDQRRLIEEQSYVDWQDGIAGQVQVNRYYISDMTMVTRLREVATSEGSGVQAGQ
ncbi:MAG TPA: peptidylprolyl isomerase [Dehalococcoidia bacterium]|nr:peptidylprolyl isomerase [Dehalococcoidia bacterium]